jgi:hypothetical protein
VLKKDKAIKKVTKFMPKSYIRLTPEVNLINFFGINLLTLFCKLDHFNVEFIFLCCKNIQLLKRTSKFAPKKI